MLYKDKYAPYVEQPIFDIRGNKITSDKKKSLETDPYSNTRDIKPWNPYSKGLYQQLNEPFNYTSFSSLTLLEIKTAFNTLFKINPLVEIDRHWLNRMNLTNDNVIYVKDKNK